MAARIHFPLALAFGALRFVQTILSMRAFSRLHAKIGAVCLLDAAGSVVHLSSIRSRLFAVLCVRLFPGVRWCADRIPVIPGQRLAVDCGSVLMAVELDHRLVRYWERTQSWNDMLSVNRDRIPHGITVLSDSITFINDCVRLQVLPEVFVI